MEVIREARNSVYSEDCKCYVNKKKPQPEQIQVPRHFESLLQERDENMNKNENTGI